MTLTSGLRRSAFFDQNPWNLVGFFDDPEFLDTFKHYGLTENWVQQNLNGQKKMFMSPKIRFVRKES
jgi:hypothetical protein